MFFQIKNKWKKNFGAKKKKIPKIKIKLKLCENEIGAMPNFMWKINEKIGAEKKKNWKLKLSQNYVSAGNWTIRSVTAQRSATSRLINNCGH